MNEDKVRVADARAVIRDLYRNPRGRAGDYWEINVSFRGLGGAVGRRDYTTHWIHWYPAKMFHRIPSAFMDVLELPAPANILDPYCGSGTVLLEANLRGHHAIGVDINPLARLISRVKTTPIDPSRLRGHLAFLEERVKRSRARPRPQSTLDYWLSPAARVGLHRLVIAIAEVHDTRIREFLLVTLSSIVRKVSKADPAIPPLVKLSQQRAQTAGPDYRKALERSQSITTEMVYTAFNDTATANIARMAQLYSLHPWLGDTQLCPTGFQAARTGLQPDSVDIILTSPPYCGSQKYVRSMKLELLLSGCSPVDLKQIDRDTLGTEAVTARATLLTELLTGDHFADNLIQAIYKGNPVRARMASEYSKHLVEFSEECRRVLRPGGHLLVTLGRSTLAGVRFPADRLLHRACQAVGLESIATLVDSIPSRGLLTQRHRTARRIDHEFIAWLRRPDE